MACTLPCTAQWPWSSWASWHRPCVGGGLSRPSRPPGEPPPAHPPPKARPQRQGATGRGAKEAPRRRERESAAVLDTMSELVVYQDTEMRWVWANRAAAEAGGLPPAELAGRYCYEIWYQRSEPCAGCPVVKARETGQPHSGE